MSLTITPTYEQIQVVQNQNNVIQVSAQGPVGPGVPNGGIAGQYLRKQSAVNQDTAWANIAIGEVTGLSAALAALQPLNANLTAISAITFADNDFLQRISGTLTNRTPAQVKASLAITTADVSGLGTIATQNANAVAITGGTVNGATIGATTPASGAFTTLTATGSIRAGYSNGLSIRNSTNTADISAVISPGSTADSLRFGNTTTVSEMIGSGLNYRNASGVRFLAMPSAVANVHINPEANASPAGNVYLQVTGATTGNILMYLYANARESVNFGNATTEGGHFVSIRSIATTQRTLRLDALASQSVDILQVRDSSSNDLMTLATTGTTAHYRRDAGTNDTQTVLTLGRNSSNTPAANFASGLLFQLKTSTTTDQNAASIITSLVVATHASYTARQVFNIYDAGGAREAFRIQASGSAPMIGFLGAAAAVRQTGGALTAGATYGANEQTMLQRVFDMGRTFGLLD